MITTAPTGGNLPNPDVNSKPEPSYWSTYRRLLRYARPYLGVFLIGVLGMILFAASQWPWPTW